MAAIERTLSIIKPDATARPGAAGEILSRFEKAGLQIIAMKKIQLSEQLARGFYAVHKERPFYRDLVEFMTSGPVVVSVLEGPNAIAAHRDLLGPTNSKEAPAGTIRGDFGTDIERNATHGSDAPETARIEIAYFFNAAEILAPVAGVQRGLQPRSRAHDGKRAPASAQRGVASRSWGGAVPSPKVARPRRQGSASDRAATASPMGSQVAELGCRRAFGALAGPPN
jgi:nucleoside-diphosphate kinase